MKELIKEATKFSPKVRFVPSEKILEIEGFSLPENVVDLYMPALEWLDEFEQEVNTNNELKKGQYNMNFRLTYFNSASLRYIVDIIKKVNSFYQKGLDICVNWFYENGDTQIKEAGNELSELVNIPFRVVESD